MIEDKKKVVLHACCAVCLGHPYVFLRELGYDVFVLFYNPNIYPQEEYNRRRDELIRFCKINKIGYEILEDSESVFYECIKGLEDEPEKGHRCEKCFALRLEKTAEYAKKNGAKCFTTTLSVSPHKKFSQIAFAAKNASEKFNVEYLEMDFKKQNGFLKTNEIARKYNFYRQKYCGCKFSIKL